MTKIPSDREVKTVDDSRETDQHVCPVTKNPHNHEAKVSRDDWLNTKILKLLGIVYGIATPFVVWLVITIYNHNTDIALQKMRLEHLNEKMTVVAQINEKIDAINASINKIQIDIATLKAKAGIP
jgi:hypothetical protein